MKRDTKGRQSFGIPDNLTIHTSQVASKRVAFSATFFKRSDATFGGHPMRRQKFVVRVRSAELLELTWNEDGTFDLEYKARQKKEPAILRPSLESTIPPNGVAYIENVGDDQYIFVCDKETGEHLGMVCDCGFRSCKEWKAPCRSCKHCVKKVGLPA